MPRLKRPAPEPESEPGPDDEITEPLIYDMDQAGAILGNISKPTIYRLIRRGKLQKVKQGKRIGFTARELRRYVRELEDQKQSPE